MTDPTNAERAARVEDAIRDYAEQVFALVGDREDHQMVVGDFLADVFHWAQQHGVDVDEAIRMGRLHFGEEMEQENDTTTDPLIVI